MSTTCLNMILISGRKKELKNIRVMRVITYRDEKGYLLFILHQCATRPQQVARSQEPPAGPQSCPYPPGPDSWPTQGPWPGAGCQLELVSWVSKQPLAEFAKGSLSPGKRATWPAAQVGRPTAPCPWLDAATGLKASAASAIVGRPEALAMLAA